MESSSQLPENNKNKPLGENQDKTDPIVYINKIELSYQAVNRLARILADIAENSKPILHSKEETRLNKDE